MVPGALLRHREGNLLRCVLVAGSGIDANNVCAWCEVRQREHDARATRIGGNEGQGCKRIAIPVRQWALSSGAPDEAAQGTSMTRRSMRLK